MILGICDNISLFEFPSLDRPKFLQSFEDIFEIDVCLTDDLIFRDKTHSAKLSL